MNEAQMSFAATAILCRVPTLFSARHIGLRAGVGHESVHASGKLRHRSSRFRNLKCRGRVVMSTEAVVSEPPVGYRPNVGVCLINDKNQVWVGARLDLPNSWQMPQGGVDFDEDPKIAAFRELREETGVTSAELIGEVPEWLVYDFPPDVRAKLTRLWGKPWKGQAQKCDNEVDLKGDGLEPAEFVEWKWMSAEEVIRMVVDFKRPVYIKAFRSLAVHVDSWLSL